MILLDDVQYNVKTPDENASDMVETVNQFCANNNIVNNQGDLIQIEPNYANPLYIMFYGLAYLVSRLQKLIYSAGCALSIPSSSEKQLLNIADACGIHRKEATKTTINCIVYSNVAGQNAVACRVTTDLSVTVAAGGTSVVFHPAYDITIPIGESRSIVLIAETYGSYSIEAGNINSFDENPVGFRSLVSLSSVPGQAQESIAALRQRIQRRTTKGTRQDLAIEAIGQLEGVSVCNIYFNTSVDSIATINGIQVPPRQALLFVQGFSNDIAKTYWSYMTTRCAGENETNAVRQVYTTRAGQELPVYIFTPTLVPVFIRLYFNQTIDDVKAQSMRDKIAQLAASLTIGQGLTSTQVVDAIQESFIEQPAGCQMSLTDSNYGFQVKVNSYQLISFILDNTHIQIINADA